MNGCIEWRLEMQNMDLLEVIVVRFLGIYENEIEI